MRATQSPSLLERRVSNAVEAARKERRLRPEVLCVAAGISRASYYSRVTSGGWRLAELERVAAELGVPLGDLLTGGSEFACTTLALVSDDFALAA